MMHCERCPSSRRNIGKRQPSGGGSSGHQLPTDEHCTVSDSPCIESALDATVSSTHPDNNGRSSHVSRRRFLESAWVFDPPTLTYKRGRSGLCQELPEVRFNSETILTDFPCEPNRFQPNGFNGRISKSFPAAASRTEDEVAIPKRIARLLYVFRSFPHPIVIPMYLHNIHVSDCIHTSLSLKKRYIIYVLEILLCVCALSSVYLGLCICILWVCKQWVLPDKSSPTREAAPEDNG